MGGSPTLSRSTSLSPHLQRKLKESLGTEAAEDLVTWMEQNDSLRADVAELRHAMELGFTRIEARMVARFDAQAERTRADLAQVRADLLKWSFVFWTGAVLAIAPLAGVLRSQAAAERDWRWSRVFGAS